MSAAPCFIAGPSADGALGIYVVRASSYDEAAALAATEPLVIEGVGVEVIDWTVHQILGSAYFAGPI